jgi:hypothetical protein
MLISSNNTYTSYHLYLLAIRSYPDYLMIMIILSFFKKAIFYSLTSCLLTFAAAFALSLHYRQL